MKKLKRNFVFILMIFACSICLNTAIVFAAEVGTTMDNPVYLSFDQSYRKGWLYKTDHLNHYIRMFVPSTGVVSMNFSKPFDSEGEYGSLKIAVSTADGKIVWNTSSNDAKSSASSNYEYKIGLDAGVYYITVKPGFYVRSGNITTDYQFTFTPNDYIEVEPNEDMAHATYLEPNEMYESYAGTDGGSDGKIDYFKFYAVKDQEYRISFDNYGKLSNDAYISVYQPNGESIYARFTAIDANGYQYFALKAKETGMYYIKVSGSYFKSQIKYGIGIYTNYVVKTTPTLTYQTGVQQQGWLNPVSNGVTSGTVGSGLRMEGLKINIKRNGYSGNIEYRSHVQKLGWESTWKQNGETSGTNLGGLRLEAIQIRLTGELAENYDVYYRIHSQRFGWLDWAKNGASAGTSGFGFRVEAIQIKLVKKGGSAPGSTTRPYVSFDNTSVTYQTQVQKKGWLSAVSNGATSGTVGQGLRMETLKINLKNQGFSGNIEYRTHIQKQGWESTWKKNGATSGTVGLGLRLEALQLRLTGNMAKEYDIYYRVQAQKFGWLGWAKNGESAGTAGYGYRLEAIQIVLVRKGMTPPGSTKNHFYQV